MFKIKMNKSIRLSKQSRNNVIRGSTVLNKINSNKHEYILTKKEWSKWDIRTRFKC